MVVIVALWEKFQNNPTLTSLDTDYHTWNVKFPAVTFCPINPIANKKVDQYRLKMWGDNKNNSVYKSMLRDIANISNYNLKSFGKYNEAINFTLTDLRELQTKINVFSLCNLYLNHAHTKQTPFNCCDRLIYVHSAEETPTVELSPLYTWRYDMGKILFTDKQTYTTSDSRQLSIKQRKCAFPDEIKLDTDVYYTFSAGYKYCDLKGLGCLSQFSDMFQEAKICTCTFACMNHVYELEKLQNDFIFWRYIAGLFLGFSLLSGVGVCVLLPAPISTHDIQERGGTGRFADRLRQERNVKF
ncbi:hypothetical protein L9F63_027280 [Diploptera punctata]|uniref:Uncharacterized protein n=1 Tax=Diploptera punctata TaxID=6984 RepID=A0AAD8EMJ2_DIPPU|nr:hypothetical protein L9F63_027280 [Diploptera punctata]